MGYGSTDSRERDLHDVPGVVTDDKVSVSLQLLRLGVDLPAGVVGMTFELLVHGRQKVLNMKSGEEL